MTKCFNCLTEETPMWRRCIDSKLGSFITLCNACGLYYKAKGDHRPHLLITKKSQITKYEHLMSCLATEADETENKMVQFNDEELSDVRIISCVNCKCINTSLWRKDSNGNSMCNACGLFYKKNGSHRPVKEDVRDVFIEIDSNVIRYNKIKRRKRSASKVHDREYERASKSFKKNPIKEDNDHHSTTHETSDIERPSSTASSQYSLHSSPSPRLIINSSTSPDLNYYTLTPQSSTGTPDSGYSPRNLHIDSHIGMSILPPATLLLPQSALPHEMMVNPSIPFTRVCADNAPRLPPISFLIKAIDSQQRNRGSSTHNLGIY